MPIIQVKNWHTCILNISTPQKIEENLTDWVKVWIWNPTAWKLDFAFKIWQEGIVFDTACEVSMYTYHLIHEPAPGLALCIDM